MNFASLLRIHQNRQAPPSYSPNQYLLNCNRKLDHPIVYGSNNYSGIKKRQPEMMESLGQDLFGIYQSFEENPHTQWILELQVHNVRIHKFKPSKIKLRKDDHDEQQLYPKIPHHRVSHQPDQEEPNHRHQLHHLQQRKNYSPMQKIRPKTFGREENFIESTNQNKFSFGEDSGHAIEEDLQSKQQHSNQQQSLNKNYIEERHEYQLSHNHPEQRPKPYCVNLMDEFDKCDEFNDNQRKNLQVQNDQNSNKRAVNQLANIDGENHNGAQKQPNPDSRIDFNPNVGFSFDEIDKICQPTQNTIGPVSENKVQVKSQNHVIHTDNTIISAKQTSTKSEEPHTKTVQKPTLNRETSLKNIVEQDKRSEKPSDQQSAKKIHFKPVENPLSEQKQKQSSPHRIYCKAVIRNLTPQKFKYPRVDSKIQANTEVKPFLSETDTKKEKPQNAIKVVTEKKTQQNETEKKMITVPSSERLLALIDESKRLLESRTVNEENRPEDRIKRIVLHQTNTKETETPQPKDNPLSQNKTSSQNVQTAALPDPNPKIIINAPKQILQIKELNLNSTPKQKQLPQIQTVSSPKSPVQQKPKFHNQLANMQTNYTPQKRAQQNPSVRPSTIARNPSPKQGHTQVTQQFVSTTYTKTHSESASGLQPNQQQQNYFQSSYAYKPINFPPYNNNKTDGQKEVLGYKPYQPNGQINNQPYHLNTNNHQIQNDATNQAQKTQPQVYPYTGGPAVKTYSPYFPISTTKNTKPSAPLQPTTELKPSTVYQTYTYSGFPSTQQVPSSTQPLTNNNNNYIKINPNYISPLQKFQQKTQQKDFTQNQVNLADWRQKENFKPTVGLGIQGVKCVESKIYEPSNKLTTLQSDPKESSVQFSLRIEEHFHIGNK